MRLVHIPGVPPLPSLWFRMFEPATDYPAMIDVLNAVGDADALERSFTLETLRADDESAGDFDPSQGRFVAEIDSQMIGVGTVHPTQLQDATRIYFHTFDLLPAWRRKGIGRAALLQCQKMLRGRAAAHLDSAAKFFSSYGVYVQQIGTIALLERDGYAPVRSAYRMVRPELHNLPQFAAPDAIRIVPMDPAKKRKIWEAIQEAFCDAWGFIPSSDAAYEAWARNPLLRPELSRIAWAGEEVAGTTLVFIDDADNRKRNRRRAYTETVAVRRPWRRRGLAKSLLAQALHSVAGAGMQEAALSVDTENVTGALKLYQDLGYTVEKQTRTYRKPLK